LGKCKDVKNYYCMFASRVRVSGTSLSFLFVIARKSLRASTSFEYLRALSTYDVDGLFLFSLLCHMVRKVLILSDVFFGLLYDAVSMS